MSIDPYRVFLFKKKIRAANPLIEGIRFRSSINGENLIFEPNRYIESDKVTEMFAKALSQEGIDFEIKRNPFGLYSDRPFDEQPVWYIRIPIDQEALPERRR